MSDGLDEQDVVGFGPDRPRSALNVAFARRRPWLVGGVVLLALAGAGVVAVSRHVDSPKLPTLTTARAVIPINEYGGQASRWEPGSNGRPDGPVSISLDTVLAFGGVPASGVEVFGVVGPGIEEPTQPVAQFAEDATRRSVRLSSTVDCAALPTPIPPGAYGLRIQVGAAGGQSKATIHAGAVGELFARDVQPACGTWFARRDLTVTAATANVDPRLPKATLALTVTNAGTRDAAVVLAPADDGVAITSQPPGIVRVPAGGAAPVVLTLTLRRCDSVASNSQNGVDGATRTTDDVLRLVAVVGADPVVRTNRAAVTGVDPTAIVLSQSAAADVGSALLAACGGLGGFAALVVGKGAAYDRATRTLTLPVEIDGTPGKIADLRLTTEPGFGVQPGLDPLWTSTARVVPDRTGQAVITLRYRTPKASLCPAEWALLPGFTITARVRLPSGFRTLQYVQFIDPWQDPLVSRQLCP